MRRLFANARLLDPASGLDAPGAVLVDDGKIAAVLKGERAGTGISDAAVLDVGGLCIAPGLVDMRVSTGEPGNEHVETLASAAAAAVAGGVTTMAVLPDTKPAIDDPAVLEFVQRRGAATGLVDVRPYAAATKGLAGQEMTEMALLAEAGAVGFTDGPRAIANGSVLRRLLSYATTVDGLVIQHPEAPDLVGDGVATEGETATRMGLPGIPAIAEAILLDRDMRLVALTGGRYHASRVSTEAGLAVIRAAKADGLPVTCDTAPPYFALDEGAVVGYRTDAKLSPPLRANSDREAVVAGLADGTIDAIVSDHRPCDQDTKRLPFTQARAGTIGLETLLPLTLGLVHDGSLGLLDALKRLTSGPAKILRLPAGQLAEGAPGDLVIFSPETGWRFDATAVRGRARNSAFDRRPLQGRVMRTVRGGVDVYERSGEGQVSSDRLDAAHA